MGTYTGLRFKGIVKKEFRKDFADIALNGNWKSSTDEYFQDFATDDRASTIPCASIDIPAEWATYMNDKQRILDGFDKTYNEETGYWTFACGVKDYNNTIEKFLALVPYFIESVECCEILDDLSTYSEKYELINNQMVLTEEHYIKYKDEY